MIYPFFVWSILTAQYKMSCLINFSYPNGPTLTGLVMSQGFELICLIYNFTRTDRIFIDVVSKSLNRKYLIGHFCLQKKKEQPRSLHRICKKDVVWVEVINLTLTLYTITTFVRSIQNSKIFTVILEDFNDRGSVYLKFFVLRRQKLSSMRK